MLRESFQLIQAEQLQLSAYRSLKIGDSVGVEFEPCRFLSPR